MNTKYELKRISQYQQKVNARSEHTNRTNGTVIYTYNVQRHLNIKQYHFRADCPVKNSKKVGQHECQLKVGILGKKQERSQRRGVSEKPDMSMDTLSMDPLTEVQTQSLTLLSITKALITFLLFSEVNYIHQQIVVLILIV